MVNKVKDLRKKYEQELKEVHEEIEELTIQIIDAKKEEAFIDSKLEVLEDLLLELEDEPNEEDLDEEDVLDDEEVKQVEAF